MSYAVIIPSKNINNLRSCIAAVKQHTPNPWIIVIDDGLSERPQGVDVIPGVKPFCYARNVNLGIRAAAGADVILLNDDAVLVEKPWGPPTHPVRTGGFDGLIKAASWTPEQYGVVSAAISGSMQPQQAQMSYPNLYEQLHGCDLLTIRPITHHMVSFVCVYIRRAVIDRVGLLDERFLDYGYDDDDYCQRVLDAGYRLGVFDGCVVQHGDAAKSSYRSQRGLSLEPNRRRFIEKWGAGPGKVRQVA